MLERGSIAESGGRGRDGRRAQRAVSKLVDRVDLPDYHLLHAARADFLRQLDRPDEAQAAYRDAPALKMNAADRAFLEGRLAEVIGS